MSTNKQALRERYSPQPVPKCHICGTEMTVQRMSASRITYGCTGATYDDTGCHYAAGRSIADDHYEQSRVTIVDVSDSDVLALLDELEAAGKWIAEHDRQCDQHYLNGMLAGWNFGITEDSDGYDSAFSARNKLIVAERAAGITVKGDSE
ncbi:ead/Ea22-like family protein [Escherichia coli]|uniref:ead/Ea22-like family protein n=1 Tax=Escherichia coli TaxID=562 RepID=UPI0039183A37